MEFLRNRILLIGLAVILGLALFYVVVQRTNVLRLGTGQIFSEKHNVKRIRVIEGHEFDLVLVDGRRIHACLTVRAPQEAKDRVVAHINKSTKPQVILHEQLEDGTWVVDLLFNEGSLTNWLYEEGLVWERNVKRR